MQNCQTAGEFISAGPSQAYWENDSHHPSNLPGSTEASELTEIEDLDSSILDQPGSEYLEWWITSMPSQNGTSILSQEPDLTMESDASLPGWGQWSSHRGTYVPSREAVPYQLPRADGCYVWSKGSLPGQGQLPNLGQSNSSVVYKSHGGELAPTSRTIWLLNYGHGAWQGE